MFSRSGSTHIDHIKHLLTLVYHNIVTLKLKKWKLLAVTINYLGLHTWARQPEIALHTTTVTGGLKSSASLMGLKVFFVVYCFFDRNIPILTQLSVPLNKRLLKDMPVVYRALNKKEIAIDELKKAAVSPPTISLSYTWRHTSHDTDS